METRIWISDTELRLLFTILRTFIAKRKTYSRPDRTRFPPGFLICEYWSQGGRRRKAKKNLVLSPAVREILAKKQKLRNRSETLVSFLSFLNFFVASFIALKWGKKFISQRTWKKLEIVLSLISRLMLEKNRREKIEQRGKKMLESKFSIRGCRESF